MVNDMNEVERKHGIARELFKAIHEGKWVSIEYQNQNNQITKYWIGIKNVNPIKRVLDVEGLHLSLHTVERLKYIYIDSIISADIVEGTYFEKNNYLIKDISENPDKYKGLFDHVANLKILNYLEECNRMDVVPYKSNFSLIDYLDRESFQNNNYFLNDEQFKVIVSNFQYRTKQETNKLQIQQLAMNVLSIYSPKGLYVLAYRKLNLDVKAKKLRPADEITICTEFTIDGKKETARKYLDAEDYQLLNKFEKNIELIKDKIQRPSVQVDDLPYLIGLGIDIVLDLKKEYKAIHNMYASGEVSYPIKAFFGDLLKKPIRYKTYPIALINNRINIDQLLAINNGMKYPVAYIQGPPGTGKTNTIMNTISTAFFNDKKVLFSSYNNHPIDSVFEKLTKLKYEGKTIPLPILRLGNNNKVKESLSYIYELYNKTKSITVYEKTLDRRRDNRIEKAKKLSQALKVYEELLDLNERKEAIDSMIDFNKRQEDVTDMRLEFSLTNQSYNIESAIKEAGDIDEQQILKFLDLNENELYQYLYYTSVKYIQSLPKKCPELMEILELGDLDKQTQEFNKFLTVSRNVENLLKVFPIIVTTCISAHKIGKPQAYFDMVIIDEASQCNTAISLVPIIRGEQLMLVGDPQQLNPVIVLDEITNNQLKKKYNITNEYDYCKNSIYKTYLACDSVSDEVLLRNHYRCHKKIVSFNNKKYYNQKLNILSKNKEKTPLVFVDIQDAKQEEKNTSIQEAEQIVEYCKMNKDKTIGIITPFVNQRKLIDKKMKEAGLDNISCGTVHAFQGDEKEVILFSTAINDGTTLKTYNWLKNNKELINVATSRAKDKLVVLSSLENVKRLHRDNEEDDLFELIQYTRTNGESNITPKLAESRALGVKPFTTQTEETFLGTLRHALGNIWHTSNRYIIEKEVAISHVFMDNVTYDDLFYTGRFDFVVYEVQGKEKIPILAIELDGKEHFEDEVVKRRDDKKNAICKAHNMELIRVENSYARRYNYIKDILVDYFKK